MIDYLLFIWILVFLIFLVINLYTGNQIFGITAGLWLIILALAIIVTGVQIQSGMTIVTNNTTNTDTLTYQYSDATLPFSTYSYIWGIILIAISIYIIYRNAMEL